MAYGETYEEFVKKFKEKKTTDDCYTPPEVYEKVKNWAVDHYGLHGREIVRPFYPGGDYEQYDYPENCIVLDNPPFSILSSICNFYMDRNIDFFLFAPGLTLFSTTAGRANYVPVRAQVIYENGAKVSTSFITNMGKYKIETAPDLLKLLKKPKLKRGDVDLTAITSARINTKEHIAYTAEELEFTRKYRTNGRGIYGGGFYRKE